MRSERDPATDGHRLAGQERRLRLLLHHLAGRAVRQRAEIDDLLQEVYVRALTTPGGLPPARPVRDESGQADVDAELQRFLGRLARNTVIDLARAIRAAKRGGLRGPLERSSWSRTDAVARVPALAAGPPTELAQREVHATLAAAFDALPADQRRVIGLRQLEGLSARDAARRMGRSETAVHSLFRRALLAWEHEARRRGVSETAFG